MAAICNDDTCNHDLVVGSGLDLFYHRACLFPGVDGLAIVIPLTAVKAF